MLLLPTITALVLHLYQVMLLNMRPSLVNLSFFPFQITDIALRIKRVYRNIKRYAFFSGYFPAKIVNAALMESPNSEHACSMLFFTSSSSLKFTFTVCAISNTPFLPLLYTIKKKRPIIFLYFLQDYLYITLTSPNFL